MLNGIVANWGITPGQDGAGFLKELWSTPAHRTKAINSILTAYPESLVNTEATRIKTCKDVA